MAGKNEVPATSAQQAAVRWTVEGILRDVYPVQLAYTKPTKDEVQFAVDHAVHELLNGLYLQGLISSQTNLYPSIPLVFASVKAAKAGR
jgi:hypothetical protein